MVGTVKFAFTLPQVIPAAGMRLTIGSGSWDIPLNQLAAQQWSFTISRRGTGIGPSPNHPFDSGQCFGGSVCP